MPDLFLNFIIHNLAGSLIAGLWATGVALLVTRLLNIKSAVVRSKLLLLPLYKSILVLGGMVAVLPFSRSLNDQLWPRRVDPASSLLFVGAWLAIGLLLWAAGHLLAGRRLRARAAPAESARLHGSLDAIIASYRSGQAAENGIPFCMVAGRIDTPELLVGDGRVPPALFTGRPAALVVPAGLEENLDRDELDGILAHEIAHMLLRRPFLFARPLSRGLLLWLSPIGLLVSRLVHGIEEEACDELAAFVTRRPEALASALVKVQRAHQSRLPLSPYIARLTGGQALKTRVTRLLGGVDSLEPMPRLRSLLAQWLALLLVFVVI